MPLLATEAAKLSQEDMVRGIIEELIDTDELYLMLPYTQTEGKAYVYNREKALAGGSWVDPNATVTESASTFTEVTTQLRILIGDVDVDKFLNGVQSDENSQLAIQIASKIKGMSRQFRQALITGDTANKQFDGVAKLVTPEQQIVAGANGSALTFSLLDDLVDRVETGADALIMRKGTFRAYKALLRAAGGTTPQMIEIENFGVMIPSHDGTPILINDFIPGDVAQGTEDETCSIYAVRFDEANGLHGLFGGQGAAGFVVEELGTVQNKDAMRTRIKAYLGLALKSTKSLAALKGITNI
jgi:HK97 family phage major capsid protein